nr:cation:proton antiporter [Oceanococcus sp. HetDA_MAG_MS8]
MLEGALLAVVTGMALVVVRIWRGPAVYDRILAVNALGTKTVLFIALLCFATGRPDFLDVALLYALINFIGTIAVLKFIHYRHLGYGLHDDGPQEESP